MFIHQRIASLRLSICPCVQWPTAHPFLKSISKNSAPQTMPLHDFSASQSPQCALATAQPGLRATASTYTLKRERMHRRRRSPRFRILRDAL